MGSLFVMLNLNITNSYMIIMIKKITSLLFFIFLLHSCGTIEQSSDGLKEFNSKNPTISNSISLLENEEKIRVLSLENLKLQTDLNMKSNLITSTKTKLINIQHTNILLLKRIKALNELAYRMEKDSRTNSAVNKKYITDLIKERNKYKSKLFLKIKNKTDSSHQLKAKIIQQEQEKDKIENSIKNLSKENSKLKNKVKRLSLIRKSSSFDTFKNDINSKELNTEIDVEFTISEVESNQNRKPFPYKQLLDAGLKFFRNLTLKSTSIKIKNENNLLITYEVKKNKTSYEQFCQNIAKLFSEEINTNNWKCKNHILKLPNIKDEFMGYQKILKWTGTPFNAFVYLPAYFIFTVKFMYEKNIITKPFLLYFTPERFENLFPISALETWLNDPSQTPSPFIIKDNMDNIQINLIPFPQFEYLDYKGSYNKIKIKNLGSLKLTGLKNIMLKINEQTTRQLYIDAFINAKPYSKNFQSYITKNWKKIVNQKVNLNREDYE